MQWVISWIINDNLIHLMNNWWEIDMRWVISWIINQNLTHLMNNWWEIDMRWGISWIINENSTHLMNNWWEIDMRWVISWIINENLTHLMNNWGEIDMRWVISWIINDNLTHLMNWSSRLLYLTVYGVICGGLGDCVSLMSIPWYKFFKILPTFERGSKMNQSQIFFLGIFKNHRIQKHLDWFGITKKSRNLKESQNSFDYLGIWKKHWQRFLRMQTSVNLWINLESSNITEIASVLEIYRLSQNLNQCVLKKPAKSESRHLLKSLNR